MLRRDWQNVFFKRLVTLKNPQRMSVDARLYQLKGKYPTSDRSDARRRLGTTVLDHSLNHSYMTFQCNLTWQNLLSEWLFKIQQPSISYLPTRISDKCESIEDRWLNHQNSIETWFVLRQEEAKSRMNNIWQSEHKPAWKLSSVAWPRHSAGRSLWAASTMPGSGHSWRL